VPAQPTDTPRRRRATSRRERLRATLHAMGPGLVSGAADDDPSGIATIGVKSIAVPARVAPTVIGPIKALSTARS